MARVWMNHELPGAADADRTPVQRGLRTLEPWKPTMRPAASSETSGGISVAAAHGPLEQHAHEIWAEPGRAGVEFPDRMTAS